MALDSIRAAMNKRGFTEYANERWSWGGTRPDDGAVVLCVWESTETTYDKTARTLRAQVTWGNKATDKNGRVASGVGERERHVEAIRNGARGLLLVGQRKNPGDLKEREWVCAADAKLWRIVAVEPTDADGITHVRAALEGGSWINSDGDFCPTESGKEITERLGTDGGVTPEHLP